MLTLDEKLTVIRAAFAGIAAGDADAMLAWYTDDLVLELPYGDPPGKRIEGRPTVREYLAAAFRVFSMELRITEVYELVDPDVLVLEYESVGRYLPEDRPYANHYVGVYRFVGDRIASVREFYDPTRAGR